MSGMTVPVRRRRGAAGAWLLAAAAVFGFFNARPLCAQVAGNTTPSDSSEAGSEPPVMDNQIMGHVWFDQLEGRSNGPDNEFRWEGEGWVGTDMNKLWFKSEGFAENGRATDGDTEALYDRPIPFLRYFDAQAGVRYDLDSNPGRTWGAIGIEGLAPYFFEFAPTFYFSDGGRIAGRVEGSYDLMLTQRLIAQPQFEINMYSTKDPSRGIGSGFSDLDTGLRIRYELSRKFAPYIGFAYTGAFGQTATYTREAGGAAHDPRLIFGTRVWY
ncbi:MAG TPA: copper resistance protein B [Candidatus Binataceae bacterium]|nr:copper resistance protein B [Candidatus Binataceae bacterium]